MKDRDYLQCPNLEEFPQGICRLLKVLGCIARKRQRGETVLVVVFHIGQDGVNRLPAGGNRAAVLS